MEGLTGYGIVKGRMRWAGKRPVATAFAVGWRARPDQILWFSDRKLVIDHGQASSGFGAEPLAAPDGNQKRKSDDDERDQPRKLSEPQRQLVPPRQSSDVIDRGTDAEGLKFGSVENGHGTGNVARLLDLQECVHERGKSIRVLKGNGDDASAAHHIVR